ncbi:hypothetical protein BDV93DRAFT_561937 [Ceratobasidium sp. AG-I]|nr:hypothetical protein BDV93DRAFT_561937 [Ceratobasidium sp. AG-I]
MNVVDQKMHQESNSNSNMEHEDTCYMCGDGGTLMLCDSCPAAYCYSNEADAEYPGCLSFPPGHEQDPFCCPECLRLSPTPQLTYKIQRTVRKTRRRAAADGSEGVVLVILHIPNMSEPARVLERRVSSYLRALDLEVITHRLNMREGSDTRDVSGPWNGRYFNRNVPPRPFRLWCIFMSESDPDGGWWVDDGDSYAQSSEYQVLDFYLQGLHSWAEHAVTADIIFTSCGVNLGLADSRRQVISYISPSPWNHLFAAATAALHTPYFTAFFPDFIAQVCYNRFPAEEALLRAWLKFNTARLHTDVFVFSNAATSPRSPCVLYASAPGATRPFGVDIPVVDCVCSCVQTARQKRWMSRYESSPHKTTKEVLLFFVTSCCKYEMHLAVSLSNITPLEKHGSRIVRIPVDENGRKLFDRSTMTCFKFSPTRLPGDRPVHDGFWTAVSQAM